MTYNFTASSGNNAQARVKIIKDSRAHFDVLWDTTPTDADSKEFDLWLSKETGATISQSLVNPTPTEELAGVAAFFADRN